MEKFEIKPEIAITVTQEDIDDIMTTALEGGINYWCYEAKVVGGYLGEWASDQISRGGTLKLYDSEEDEVYDLTRGKFLEGLKKWMESGMYREGTITDGKIDTGEIDAMDADCIIQMAIFGELVYG